MSPSLFWVAVVAALAIVIILAFTLLGSSDSQKKESTPSADVSINAAEGSIVTVRKVGRTTRVVIRSDIHDHWEGSDGIDLSPAPIEITKQEEPELYAEYMSPKTSALRKYEIADYIYSLGLTLPYIHGLHEQWQKEREAEKAAASSGDPAKEATPVNPSGGQMRGGVVYRKLDINHNLREAPIGGMDPEEEVPVPEQQPSETDTENETDNE